MSENILGGGKGTDQLIGDSSAGGIASGASGIDFVKGGTGNDPFVGDHEDRGSSDQRGGGRDRLCDGSGNDRVDAGPEKDRCGGGDNNDRDVGRPRCEVTSSIP